MAANLAKKDHASKKPFVDSLDLPASYNRTKLTLISRDPHWIYAYWEIAPSTIEDARAEIGPDFDRAVYTLRMFDVACIDFNGYNANRQFDIDVGPHANNWYVNIWNDNVSFCAELGLRLPDGRFFKLARSNFVTTPRSNPSNRRDQMWRKEEGGNPGQPYVLAQPRKNSRGRVRRIDLTEDDVRAYYSRLSPLLRAVIARRLARRGGSPPDLILKGSGRNNFFSREFAKTARRTGSSEETISSGASEHNQPGRKFFFELGTELIVYGRTEPDAKVWWGDKAIALRGDGTFGMRLALPDGKIPLGFTAVSKDDAEKREISTGVEREKTRYA